MQRSYNWAMAVIVVGVVIFALTVASAAIDAFSGMTTDKDIPAGTADPSIVG